MDFWSDRRFSRRKHRVDNIIHKNGSVLAALSAQNWRMCFIK